MGRTATFRGLAGWKRSVPAAILLALAAALIIAALAWTSAAGLRDAGDTARTMAPHPIVRMPAQFRA